MKFRRSLSLLLAVAAAESTVSSLMPVMVQAEEAAEKSRTDVDAAVKESISKLIAFYGSGYRADVIHELKTLNGLSAEWGQMYASIMNMWDYIEEDMPENIAVAPDGLENGGEGHAFIVLGFALNSDGTMKDELVGRLETALNCAEKYPNSYILVTGGVEKNGWTEGQRMHDWLIEHGVAENRILVENKAPDTAGNASNSFKILYGMDDVHTVSVISSQYHIKRGSILYYAESVLRAWELNKTPITFLPDMNAGWYRADKTSESMSQKASSMRSVCRASSISASKFATQVTGLEVSSPSHVEAGDALDVQVITEDSLGYGEDVSAWSSVSGYLRYACGRQHPSVSYTHGSKTISEPITVTVSTPDAVDASLLENLLAECEGLNLNLYSAAIRAAFESEKAAARSAMESGEGIQEAYLSLSKAALSLEQTSNVALKKPVTANYGESTAAKITDGTKSIGNYWSSMNGSENAPIEDSWFVIDLEDECTLDSVILYPYWNGNRYYHYDVLTSLDGENWTLQDAWRSNDVCTSSGNLSSFEAPVKARYIKVQGVKVFVPDRPDINNFHVSELEAFGSTSDANRQAADSLKKLLAMSIDYAESINLDQIEHLNGLVRAHFQSALEEAVYVLDDVRASQSDVEQAWKTLVSAIHMLDFTSDPSALEELVSRAEALNPDEYLDGEAKDEFAAALAHAKEVLADPAALEEGSLAEAAVRLQQAMDALQPVQTLDTSLLAWLISQTEPTDLSLYTPGSAQTFADALAQAKTVLEAPESQEQIFEAIESLHTAWMNLRLRPDESVLQQLRDFVEATSSLSGQTYSVDQLEALLKGRQTVLDALADPELDQEKAGRTLSEIEPLLSLLSKASDTPVSTQKTPAQPAASSKAAASAAASVKTAYGTHLISWLGAAAASALVLLGKRRRH